MAKKQTLEQLLSIVDEKMVVTFDPKSGAVYIGGERADAAKLNNLKQEAEFFMQSDLWKIINESVKELAHRAMFNADGDLEKLLLKGRSMLYLLDTQKRIVTTFKSFIPKQENMPVGVPRL